MDKEDTLLIDFINILSFIIGVENLSINNEQVKQLEDHLSKQDKQYEEILEILKERGKNGRINE